MAFRVDVPIHSSNNPQMLYPHWLEDNIARSFSRCFPPRDSACFGGPPYAHHANRPTGTLTLTAIVRTTTCATNNLLLKHYGTFTTARRVHITSSCFAVCRWFDSLFVSLFQTLYIEVCNTIYLYMYVYVVFLLLQVPPLYRFSRGYFGRFPFCSFIYIFFFKR